MNLVKRGIWLFRIYQSFVREDNRLRQAWRRSRLIVLRWLNLLKLRRILLVTEIERAKVITLVYSNWHLAFSMLWFSCWHLLKLLNNYFFFLFNYQIFVDNLKFYPNKSPNRIFPLSFRFLINLRILSWFFHCIIYFLYPNVWEMR